MLIFEGRDFRRAGMRVARVGAPGSRVPGFPGRGWQARRSGHRGERPQPGQDLREQAVAGREPQDQVAGVADQPAGMAMSRRRRVAIMALPPRTP